MVQYAKSALRHYELLGTHFENLKGYESYAAQSAAVRANPQMFTHAFSGSHPWGAPEKVIARATELAEAFGCDELMFVFKYGSMPIAEAEKSMRMFASEVMPALKALNPPPMRVLAPAA
jgi:hypothetical protein